MAIIQIPKHVGTCRVITSYAGTPLITNDKTGKNKVLIPCKTPRQASELCDRINRGDHDGTVRA
ncbi:hypothetical protein Poly30_33760 [Planctomycetes bacterium Poly30]|uniref:Uncharacterized protein n=1 Tax=Saltatorellus ferox TaxID=2528018 RepID=A0A518EUR7_9BACT|nr:hypothetical protein Poly30_33760 [Planctomycetes bacterium Poly30]